MMFSACTEHSIPSKSALGSKFILGTFRSSQKWEMLYLYLIYGSKFELFDDLGGFSENCEGEIAMNYVSGLKKLTLFVSLQIA